MKVCIGISATDNQSETFLFVLQDFFGIIGDKLEGNYGGIMEELWIDFELVESFAKKDKKQNHAFRFAKRVSGRSHFGFPPSPDSFNIGHFSVRPDFNYLRTNTAENIIRYCLKLIYIELQGLKTKEKKLGGFNSELLCKNFFEECKSLGINLI